MKILHVIIDLKPTAGTTVFCEAICKAQIQAGHSCAIVTKRNYTAHKLSDWDVVHMHSVWNPFNVRVLRDCLTRGIPIVVSLHGCLMPRVFQKGRIKKWIFWYLFLRPLLMKANAIHCTSEAEKKACKKLGLPVPFIVAPLGVYLPDFSQPSTHNHQPSTARTVLFLGRLGEEKGLLNLLEAWHQLQNECLNERIGECLNLNHSFPHKLIIAGPDWLGYKAKMDAKIAADHIEGVEFPGLVQGEAKDEFYREADIFVLPSPMENFSMVVLDALAYGIPTIATKGTPWQELETEHCGLWIDQGVEPLKQALSKLLNISTDQLRNMGENGRRLAEQKYQWPMVADKLLSFYKEIIT